MPKGKKAVAKSVSKPAPKPVVKKKAVVKQHIGSGIGKINAKKVEQKIK